MGDLISRKDALDAISAFENREYRRKSGSINDAYKLISVLPSAQPDSKDLVEKIKNGITVSNGNNEYFIGLRNGMRWCLSLIDDKEPIYESFAGSTLREKALLLLLDWAVECGFGYDNIPEEYATYEKDVASMSYTEGLIYIAEREVEKNERLNQQTGGS